MLRFDQLSCRRGARLLFSDATFNVYPGHKLGIVGANGCGKSSLLALVSGELGADAGLVDRPRDWRLARVEQETPALPCSALQHTLDGDTRLGRVREGLARAQAARDGMAEARWHAELEALDGYDAEPRAARLLAGLGFEEADMQRPVASFSGGWRMRLNLARALMARADLLLLDEPTNHLDLDAVLWLEQWLTRFPGTLLLISHDRDFLDRICDHILHIEGGGARLYRGNYSAFERQRAAYLANQQAAYQRQQQVVADMERFITRFRAKATKARQAQSRLKALARMEAIAPAHVDSEFEFHFPPPARMPGSLLHLERADFGYQGRSVLEQVDARLLPGDRIGLLGLNGAGKSTLLRGLAGAQAPLAGRREGARDLRLGYFAQHQMEQLRGEDTPLGLLQRLHPDASEAQLRSFLGGFGFAGERVFEPVAVFSGGEKARLVLARLVYDAPQLLLLDEPTNHLDLEMRRALGVALQEFAGAMVLVAHDRHLLELTCDRFWLVDRGRVEPFDGDLDDYLRWLNERRQPPQCTPRAAASAHAAGRREQRREAAAERRRLRPLRAAAAEHEAKVERLGRELAELERRLTEPDTYDQGRKAQLQAMLADQGRLRAAVAAAEEAWLAALEALQRAESAADA